VVEFWSARKKLWCMKKSDRDRLLRHFEEIVETQANVIKRDGVVRWLQLGPETLIASLGDMPVTDPNPVRDALRQQAWDDYFELLAYSQDRTTGRNRTVFPGES